MLDRPVGEPVVHGVGEPVEDVEGCLVLLTGGRPARSETVEAIRAAAAGGAHAVVVKAWGDDLGTAVGRRAGLPASCCCARPTRWPGATSTRS